MCARLYVFVYIGRGGKTAHPFELSTLCLTDPPGNANFSGCFHIGFNCLTLLISSSLTTNGGSGRPLFSLSASLSHQQSVRQSGLEAVRGGTKWLGDEPDARCLITWTDAVPDTTATGSLNKVPLTTEERTPDPGLLYFCCLLFFRPLPCSVCFNLSHLLVPFFFLPSVHLSVSSLSLHLQTLAHCFSQRYLNMTEVKGTSSSHPSFPLALSLLNCMLSERVGFLLRAALPRHAQCV